jgi:glyoxylase-like metal-dependent hydrolase (beta-lactamase superfamily II)
MKASPQLTCLLRSVVCLYPLLSPLAVLAAETTLTAAEFQAAALDALGAKELTGIEFSGKGWDACLGQAWSINEGWARWELTDYRRTIDFTSGATRHSAQRRAGMDKDRIGGCGAQPNASAAPQQSFTDSAAAWPDQLVMWLTPQGFLHLLNAGDETIAREATGWQVTLPLVRDALTYTLVGHFNQAYQLTSVQTWIDDSVFGDMEVLAEFGAYHVFNGATFPRTLSIKQGGFATLALTIDNATPSTETLVNPNPRRAAAPAAAAQGPAFTEIGNGIFAINGAYQAVAVEFDTFSVVIDGLQSDSRVQELIRLVKAAIPNKPIRYVVSTHSHFDHANGLRQFAAAGATIVTHQMNVPFFQKALATPRTLRATAIEPNQVPITLQGVDGHFAIKDNAGQTIELHALAPSAHAADMLIAYLPSIKAIVEADVLQPWINPVFGGKNGPHPFLAYLRDELNKLQLSYESFVPIHVPPTPPLMQKADLEAVLSGK